MTTFNDTTQLNAMMEDLWTYVINETIVGTKLSEFDVSYKFIVSNPAGYIYVDSKEVITGKRANRDAVISMELSGDSIHKFWLKKLNLPVAMATRKIKTKGPIPKMLKMLPFLKSVYDLYPEFCKKHGVSISN